jgi:hypothetical protein
VLFVGDDASSPQIAASLLREAARDEIAVDTADTQPADPGGRASEMLVAMGLNPIEEKRLNARALHTADYVVVLGADIDVARLPGPHYEEWDLAHDNLIERVEALRDDLTTPPAQQPRSSILDRLRALGKTGRHR